ncbi:MAG: hypothetical protein H6736_23020 [Alphaproteobacteria bacterium]|nr:hypothetical protein [Alphaproteobacteria bacterium]
MPARTLVFLLLVACADAPRPVDTCSFTLDAPDRALAGEPVVIRAVGVTSVRFAVDPGVVVASETPDTLGVWPPVDAPFTVRATRDGCPDTVEVTVEPGGTPAMWGEPLPELDTRPEAVAWAADGSLFLGGPFQLAVTEATGDGHTWGMPVLETPSLATSPDATRVAFGGVVFDTDPVRPVAAVDLGLDPLAAAFSTDGATLFLATTWSVWSLDLSTGERAWSGSVDAWPAGRPDLHALDDGRLAVDGQLLDPDTGIAGPRLECAGEGGWTPHHTRVRPASDGRLWVVGRQVLCRIDPSTGEEDVWMRHELAEPTAFAIDPTGTIAVLTGTDAGYGHAGVVVDLTAAALTPIPLPTEGVPFLSDAAWSPDGSTLAVVGGFADGAPRTFSRHGLLGSP